MSKTLALRESLRKILLTVFDKVYFAAADDSAGFPFCVYNLNEVMQIDGVSRYELELNCCDYGRNTALIEAQSDRITGALNYLYKEEPNIAYTAYFARKNSVFAEDPNIMRRRLVFEINLYDKGEK